MDNKIQQINKIKLIWRNLMNENQSEMERLEENIGFSDEKIDNLVRKQANLVLLWNKQMDPLIEAIKNAKKALKVDEWTPGLNDAVAFLEKYSAFLMKNKDDEILSDSSGILATSAQRQKHIMEPTPIQLKELDQLIRQGSDVLDKLTNDIKDNQTVKSTGNRVCTAFQGLGRVLVGIFNILLLFTSSLSASLSQLGGPKTEVALFSASMQTLNSAGEYFYLAFNSFKETWTGKKEPPELISLKEEVDRIHDQFSYFKNQVERPQEFSFFKKEKEESAPMEEPKSNEPGPA